MSIWRMELGFGYSCIGILLIFILSLGCQPSVKENERIIIDDLGHQVRIKNKVERVVSLVPTNSELVCILDCERLKGGTRNDRHPEELVKRIKAGNVKVIGGGFDPNLEMIVRLEPDIIIANGPSQQRVVLPLRRMGYPVLSIYAQNIERLKKDFFILGEILDRKMTATSIIEKVEKSLKKIHNKTKGQRRKRVYLQTWPNPMITVGKGSFSHSLITLAGGINIFANLPFDSGKVSAEWVIKHNPQVLIFTDNQSEFVKKIIQRPEWRHIDGIKNKRICMINESYLRRRIKFTDGVKKIYDCIFSDKT